MKQEKICTVCGKSGKIARGYCNKHYLQWWNKKEVRLNSRSDANEYITDGDITYIVMTNRKGEAVARAIIDTENVGKCMPYRWYVNEYNYISNKKMGQLHRFILGVEQNTDHINMNRLDNRLANLRIATYVENGLNRSVRSDSKSGYKGVRTHDVVKNGKRYFFYSVNISPGAGQKRMFFGCYHSPEEAAWMYDQLAIELHGDFARTNFVYL